MPAQLLLVHAGPRRVAHEARAMCDDDHSDFGVWSINLLEHATKLRAVVVCPADASLDKLAREQETPVLGVAANARHLRRE